MSQYGTVVQILLKDLYIDMQNSVFDDSSFMDEAPTRHPGHEGIFGSTCDVSSMSLDEIRHISTRAPRLEYRHQKI